MTHRAKRFCFLVAILAANSCMPPYRTGESSATFFRTPEEAVTIINELLQSENYPALARYYLLEDGGVQIDSLTSGAYFLKKKESGPGIPGGFGKFSKPFPAGFRYYAHEPEGRFIRVTTRYEIDQGDGMVQQALQEFYLIESNKGYQLIAD